MLGLDQLDRIGRALEAAIQNRQARGRAVSAGGRPFSTAASMRSNTAGTGSFFWLTTSTALFKSVAAWSYSLAMSMR